MTKSLPSTHPYDRLTPDVILDAVESRGWQCTGGLLALNSYENRVYRVDTEDADALAVKFYRPDRWGDATIVEEHEFTRALMDLEIPAVAPLVIDGETLHRHAGFRYTLFSWQPGRAAELNSADDRRILGRYLGRLHRFGRAAKFQHRPTITIEAYGHESVEFLLGRDFIPGHLIEAFQTLCRDLLVQIEQLFTIAGDVATLRLHGDCHLGNLLWTDTGPHIVDFDDCRTGPAIQDLWMLLAGERQETEQQLAEILSGYTQFADFDPRELILIEPLRTLRMLHYSAWLGRRWDDPAFPRAFPWFNSQRYWEEQVLALREQAAALNEPPLAWINI